MEPVKELFILTERTNSMQYGIGTYLSQLELAFREEKGVRLSVIVLNAATVFFETEEKEGIIYYQLPDLRYLPGYDMQTYYTNCFRLLRKKLSFASPSPFFMLNQTAHSPFIGLIRTHYPQARILFVLHCLMWGFPLRGNTARFRHIIRQAKEEMKEQIEKDVWNVAQKDSFIFTSVDRVICLSCYARDLLLKEYQISPEKVCCIYNGLEDTDSSPFPEEQPLEERIRLRKKYYFLPDDEIILFAGRLSANKGIHELLQAFRLLLSRHPHARLLIAGDGNDVEWGTELDGIWGRVTYTGRIAKTTVHDFYRLADVGVLPSYVEQGSYVAIEMMRAGLPVVATTSTGLSEMIVPGYNGYKVNLTETATGVEFPVEELVRHLSTLLSNPLLQMETGRNARRFFEKNYTLEKMRKGYMGVMEELQR